MGKVRKINIPFYVSGRTIIPDVNILRAKTLLTPDEVADFFGVKKRTVYDWCKTGPLKTKTTGGTLRITSKSVLDNLAKDDDGDPLLKIK